MNIALITAGGVGSRMRQDIPKQFLHIENKPVLIYTMAAFQRNPQIDAIIVPTLESWKDFVWIYSKQFNITKLKWVVTGGATGQESIYNSLIELKKHCNNEDVVLVHDGNRPMVTDDIIADSLSVFRQYGSATAAIPSGECVYRSLDGGVSSSESLDRSEFYRLQTPTTYTLGKLLWAHEKAKELGLSNTAASPDLMHELGEMVYFSKGSTKNFKLTTPDDLDLFRASLHDKQFSWIK